MNGSLRTSNNRIRGVLYGFLIFHLGVIRLIAGVIEVRSLAFISTPIDVSRELPCCSIEGGWELPWSTGGVKFGQS
jgi:hypothetical protein